MIEYYDLYAPVKYEEYPDKDLYEDGELNIKQVEKKIIRLWYEGKIVLMKERGYDEIQNVILDNKRDTL